MTRLFGIKKVEHDLVINQWKFTLLSSQFNQLQLHHSF